MCCTSVLKSAGLVSINPVSAGKATPEHSILSTITSASSCPGRPRHWQKIMYDFASCSFVSKQLEPAVNGFTPTAWRAPWNITMYVGVSGSCSAVTAVRDISSHTVNSWNSPLLSEIAWSVPACRRRVEARSTGKWTIQNTSYRTCR
jgi:hypothetical protein